MSAPSKLVAKANRIWVMMIVSVKRFSILVTLLACGPASVHDPARIYGSAARACTTRYAPPPKRTFAALGAWRGAKDGSYSYVVKTSHVFDTSTTTAVRATAYEAQRDVPLQDRLKIEWIDKRDEP